LLRRLHALAPQVLARELPLLVASGSDGAHEPLDGYVGQLDLLYRDPDRGELVVADFKSDELTGDLAIAAAVRRYRPQLELYGRAVRTGLGLADPPRLELWLLDADEIVVLPPAAVE
jgi:ATP-dependent exoDNAse (exonuclease V) beta subunit